MKDHDLRAEVAQLRRDVESLKNRPADASPAPDVAALQREVASLKSAVARLTSFVTQNQMGAVGLDGFLASLFPNVNDPYMAAAGPAPTEYTGILDSAAWDACAQPRLTPPREPLDALPRGGRNPRIGCERYDSGTWIHGWPHDCPRSARR